MQEIVVKASNMDVSKSTFVDITVYDKPSIDISELVHPEEVSYKDMYEISFILNKKSRFAPYNITIGVEPVGKEWKLNQLNEDRKFVLKMYGSGLKRGKNNFEIFCCLKKLIVHRSHTPAGENHVCFTEYIWVLAYRINSLKRGIYVDKF